MFGPLKSKEYIFTSSQEICADPAAMKMKAFSFLDVLDKYDHLCSFLEKKKHLFSEKSYGNRVWKIP